MKRLLTFVLVVVVAFGAMIWTSPGLLNSTKLGLDLKGGFEILYEAQPLTGSGPVSKESLIETAKSLEDRANKTGVSEPEVTTEGENRIRIKIAGVSDEATVREMMKKPAELEFRSASGCAADAGYCKVELLGSDFVEGAAEVVYDNLNNPLISIKVKDKEKFGEITTRLVGQNLAIYLDDEMLSDPVVQQPLTDGNATISGQRTIAEAKELADVINLGALPLSLTEKYSQSVGATLGQKSLEETALAGIVASIVILLFMLVFYRLPGFIACICLLVFVWLLLAVFWMMNATLTLPGIAAFILGIGIAVDTNIITAERIKDEIRNGKSVSSALRSGNKNSFRTVIDAHITNIIVGAVLYFIGQGTVKGFAVVHLASIIINIVTNLFLTRFLLQLIVKSGRFNKPSYYGVKESEIRAL
ncbi:protein translocase subunit SecD [Cohnella thailandensis]|jgi:protein-export membrane protein, SecD/SecF family|uniref:Protein translocase subunit SecD n=1 Tax=Cohnella thailandensis TaxID=557557 RepID=A0A841SV66_9BACL|nr:protein translocase subunit SecD [Cohnella thailandensis]MBB6633955.1 protein translocase subunit SecD [Cohnella thailandensis]MBP1972638.1 SecD/SecF fusion protein [Cohnella thailandensis]